MDAPGLLLAALLCAEVAAVGLAVRARVGRPLLALLTFALVDEVAVQLLHVLAFDGAPRPLAGWRCAGWHVSIALSLGWPAALAWACWSAQKTSGPNPRDRAASPETLPGFGPDLSPVGKSRLQVARTGVVTPKPVSSPGAKMTHDAAIVNLLTGGWVGLLAGLAIVYPPSRASLRWTLLVWELCCVALAWWGLWRARGRAWGPAEACLVVLVACESAVVVVGPFASDPFTRWWIARAFYLGAWGLVCGALIKRRAA